MDAKSFDFTFRSEPVSLKRLKRGVELRFSGAGLKCYLSWQGGLKIAVEFSSVAKNVSRYFGEFGRLLKFRKEGKTKIIHSKNNGLSVFSAASKFSSVAKKHGLIMASAFSSVAENEGVIKSSSVAKLLASFCATILFPFQLTLASSDLSQTQATGACLSCETPLIQKSLKYLRDITQNQTPASTTYYPNLPPSGRIQQIQFQAEDGSLIQVISRSLSQGAKSAANNPDGSGEGSKLLLKSTQAALKNIVKTYIVEDIEYFINQGQDAIQTLNPTSKYLSIRVNPELNLPETQNLTNHNKSQKLTPQELRDLQRQIDTATSITITSRNPAFSKMSLKGNVREKKQSITFRTTFDVPHHKHDVKVGFEFWHEDNSDEDKENGQSKASAEPITKRDKEKGFGGLLTIELPL